MGHSLRRSGIFPACRPALVSLLDERAESPGDRLIAVPVGVLVHKRGRVLE